ncbi:MAG: hypothetical protein ACTS8S_22610 [Giesbergeria sp.]
MRRDLAAQRTAYCPDFLAGVGTGDDWHFHENIPPGGYLSHGHCGLAPFVININRAESVRGSLSA